MKFTQLAGLLWGGGALILFGYYMYSIVYHCKNKWVVLTAEWLRVTMVADKLERQWLLEGMED